MGICVAGNRFFGRNGTEISQYRMIEGMLFNGLVRTRVYYSKTCVIGSQERIWSQTFKTYMEDKGIRKLKGTFARNGIS